MSARYSTPDPAVDGTGQPYAYAGNNPILNTDPTGLWWGSEAWQWYAANWESGAESITMTMGGIALGNFLNSDEGSFIAGTANGLSPGLGGIAARVIAPEEQCVVESRTFAYGSGTAIGTIATIPLTGAAGGAARGPRGRTHRHRSNGRC